MSVVAGEIDTDENPRRTAGPPALVEVRDLHISFGGEEIVKGISFSVEPVSAWRSSASPARANR